MASSIKHILQNKSSYAINGSLWIELKGERFFGPGPAELLELIEETGSISRAAKRMGMSYKKAWKIIDSLNAKVAKPMVILQTGGEKGGGSLVTSEAKKILAYHRSMRKRFISFLEKETKKLC